MFVFILGMNGYSLQAVSWSGSAGNALIQTDNKFMGSICLSLWYHFISNSYDCSFSVYRVSGVNETLIYTVYGNSASFDRWISISVDAYGQDPFKVILKAEFKQLNSTAVRAILIDDTSIAYRPCRGRCDFQ